ncbi:MAG: hypothetical protein QGG42_00290 [Phycisphaerae bacterium]|jgi:hypothetical protein|nr:hypothetical protein [Phycisphaerae bacterium]
MSRISFASDLDFLKENTEVLELVGSDQARIAIAPTFQGRVMTSTLDGPRGASYGWLNRPFIASQAEDGQATFFELESSSPAAQLEPGDSINHVHRTCHFEGQFDDLNDLSMKVLGVDLNILI